jgi:hypothetical protein
MAVPYLFNALNDKFHMGSSLRRGWAVVVDVGWGRPTCYLHKQVPTLQAYNNQT